MKHIIFLLSVPIITAGIFTSCKDKNKTTPKTYCEENPGSCTSIQEAKDYFVFKKGSYWIYEEENSGDKDSVYVTESVSNTSSYDFDLRVYSTYQGYFYHYFPDFASGNSKCNPSGLISGRCVLINVSKGKPGEFIGEGDCFFFKFNKGDEETSPNSTFNDNKIIVSEIYPSYLLGNLSFSNTVKIHELNTFIEGRQPTNHYYSKRVGLVRKELLDSNQVWNLIDYHIAP